MAYIAGTAISYAAHARECSLEQLVFEASRQALERAGVARDEVDSLTLAASDQLDGRAIGTMLLAGPAGGYLVDEIRCTDDGSLALGMAAQRIHAGVSACALAVSWTKSSESDLVAATGVNAEPIFARPAGLHPLALEAIEVQRFLQVSGDAVEAFDDLAEQRRELAGRPAAHQAHDPHAPLALPIRAGHVPPRDDVAVAVVLTAQPRRVRLAGFAHGAERPVPVARRGETGALLRRTAERAYREAGVVHPQDAIVETTDHNVFRLAMSVAGLGFAADVDACRRLLDGELETVNATGGLWRRNSVLAAGLDVTARAYERLQRDGDVAICHSSFGTAGNGQAVWVLRAVG